MREETLCAGYRLQLERKAKELIEELGEKWLLHKKHAPQKGRYNAYGRKEDANSLGA